MKNTKKQNICRKEFLKKTGLGLITLIGGNLFCSWGDQIRYNYYNSKVIDERLRRIEKRMKQEEKIKENYWKIFNELPKHVHIAQFEYEGNDAFNQEIKKFTKMGGGIILEDKYISVAHIFKPRKGIIPFKLKNKKTSLYGRELKELFCDYSNDVIIFKLPTSLKNSIDEFPCKPVDKYDLGKKIYIIGNPGLKGSSTREGEISSKIGAKGDGKKLGLGEDNSFLGYSDSIIPGDSGTPVVNEDYELVGFCSYYDYHGHLGYIKKIGEFLKELKKL